MLLKRITVIVLLLTLLFTIPFAAAATEAENETEQSIDSLDSEYSVLGNQQLIKNAQSVFIYETKTNTLIYSWQADMQHYPASFVKVMTALLVLENADLSHAVTVTQSSINGIPKDAISIKLQAGEVISVENLLYSLVVASANDAASVLAEHVAGSQSAFVEMMNQRAVELGCTGTHFVNPHGLHHKDQLITARDMCRILLAALEYPLFRTMFGMIRYEIPATNLSEARRISSNNYLMNTEDVGIHFDSRVTGGRSGTTTDGYRCLASTSESGHMELVCIVMGSESAMNEEGTKVKSYGGYPETIELLNIVYSQYAKMQVLYQNQIVDQFSVMNGDCHVSVATTEDYATILPSSTTKNDLQFHYNLDPGADQAPIQKGQQLGTLDIYHGGVKLISTPIYAMNDVPIAFSKVVSAQTQKSGFPWWGILLILLVLAIGLRVAYIFVIKSKRQRKSKARSRVRR